MSQTTYAVVPVSTTQRARTQGGAAPSGSGGTTTTPPNNSRTRIAQGVRRRYEYTWANRIAGEQRQVGTPGWVPSFLGNRTVLAGAWVVSMAIVSYDEWRNNNILPRPYRLWYTSLFYGLLALASIIPGLVPLLNALAIGYTIMLLWQYYNKGGQFTAETTGPAVEAA